MTTTLTVNGTRHQVGLPDDVPLLWVLRDAIGLTGTILGGSVNVNDVDAINSAVARAQSVSFLEQSVIPVQITSHNPLFSVSNGGLNLAIPLAEFPQPSLSEKDPDDTLPEIN